MRFLTESMHLYPQCITVVSYTIWNGLIGIRIIFYANSMQMYARMTMPTKTVCDINNYNIVRVWFYHSYILLVHSQYSHIIATLLFEHQRVPTQWRIQGVSETSIFLVNILSLNLVRKFQHRHHHCFLTNIPHVLCNNSSTIK